MLSVLSISRVLTLAIFAVQQRAAHTSGCSEERRRLIASWALDPPTPGAKALVKTLHAGGLTTYFANPGAREMHLVTDLAEEGLQAVFCLFEAHRNIKKAKPQTP